MAKTLVTGGSGFIGSRVARLLAERGDDLRLTLRPRSKLDNLSGIDYEPATCDLLDRRAVRRAMKGVERVFHAAGLVSLRRGDDERLFRANVDAARTVLEEALRAGVERVVFTSSVAALGPAPEGGTANETQVFRAGHLGIAYVDSKHEGETEALRLAARGLPLVCVNPCFVLGPGDVYGGSTGVVRRFMLGRIPIYVPGAINVVDVVDVARGHLLADERGTIGERYILGNRNYTWDRFFADLGRLTGIEPPAVKLPPPLAVAFAEALRAAPGRARVSVAEVKSASQWWTYRSNKARRELGWRPSPHEETIEATVDWYREREGDRFDRVPRSQPAQYKLAAGALGAVGGAAGAAARLARGVR